MAFPQHLFRRHATNRNRDTNIDDDNAAANAAAVIDDPVNGDASSNNNDIEASRDDDNILIVPIPNHHAPHLLPQANLTFLPQQTLQQRRAAILAEVERVQRANFIHFALLCLVPTSLLLIVVAAIISEDGDCSGVEGVTVCEREERTFVNAFTTRCVCDAVRSGAAVVNQGEESGGGLF
jgi:hypothetical protein